MDAVKPLDYAPKPARARRAWRWAYLLALLIAVIAAGYLWGPRSLAWARKYYLEYRMLHYQQPSDHLAIEVTSQGLIVADTAFGLHRAFFMHGLMRPDGTERLVAMYPATTRLVNSRDPIPLWVYTVVALLPDLNGHAVIQSPNLGLPVPMQELKFFAGQPDPIDRSHFTFVAEIDGKKTIIDCWLNNDDRLVTSARP